MISHLLETFATTRQKIDEAFASIIVGQKQVLEEILVALFAEGHLLLMGVPGLGKTLIIRTLAEMLELKFKRIQFTPDLMPSDLTGVEVLQENPQTGKRHFVFSPGPLFANIILADEINRTPPKTQAALLEAMQERQLTVGGTIHPLPSPFFVLATQNPIEQEGTYALPEAQLDRFMMNVLIRYPESKSEEVEMVLRTTGQPQQQIQPVLDAETLVQLQRFVREIPVPQSVAEYAVELVRKSRPETPGASEIVKKHVHWGAGPRAAQHLVLAAKSFAALSGHYVVALEDVIRVAPAVLRHRILVNYAAQMENVNSDAIIPQLF